jgi:hypothetical protein
MDSDSKMPSELDPALQTAIDRMHELTVWGRWAFVLGLWLTVGAASLWGLRQPIGRLKTVFTWSGLRFGLFGHPISAIGLALCVGMLVSVLVWQSRNILWGLPQDERDRLKATVLRIQQQGDSHPLWKWIYGKKKRD